MLSFHTQDPVYLLQCTSSPSSSAHAPEYFQKANSCAKWAIFCPSGPWDLKVTSLLVTEKRLSSISPAPSIAELPSTSDCLSLPKSVLRDLGWLPQLPFLHGFLPSRKKAAMSAHISSTSLWVLELFLSIFMRFGEWMEQGLWRILFSLLRRIGQYRLLKCKTYCIVNN